MFSELDFEHYAQVVELLNTIADAIPSPPKNLTQEEINAYDLLLDMLAARNIPINTLVDFLGHANANTAQKYYITSTELAKQRLKKAQDEIY